MMEKIGVMTLVSQSKDFVFDNIGVLKDHLKIIFPLVLTLEFINNIAQVEKIVWVPLVTFLPVMYLYACFALSWHRSSLRGADSAHAINPLVWKPENKGFLMLFFGLILLPVIAMMLLGGVVGGFYAVGNPVLTGVIMVAVLPLIVYLFIQLVRISFLLPARSVGVKLTFAEARTASRGLIWKILGAGFLVSLAFAAIIFLYGLIIALSVGMVMSGSEPSPTMTGILTFILGVPVLAAGFVVTAINVTILSKAYQWGIQNNG